MELYIGGSGQGKKEYVMERYKQKEFVVAEGDRIEELLLRKEENPVLIDHLHLWIREKLKEGENPERMIEKLLSAYPDCIVISDEIGNGLVPVEQFEREYRDRTGRILITLAKKAERVERIICGLGQRLK